MVNLCEQEILVPPEKQAYFPVCPELAGTDNEVCRWAHEIQLQSLFSTLGSGN